MKEPWRGLLVTVGAGVILAILLGGATFVIDTQSRLAVIEKSVLNMEKSLDIIVNQGRH